MDEVMGWVVAGGRTFHCGHLRGYTSIVAQHSPPTKGSLIESHDNETEVTPNVFRRLKTSGFGIRLPGPKSRQRLVRTQNTAAGGILFRHQGQLLPYEIHTLWTGGQTECSLVSSRPSSDTCLCPSTRRANHQPEWFVPPPRHTIPRHVGRVPAEPR